MRAKHRKKTWNHVDLLKRLNHDPRKFKLQVYDEAFGQWFNAYEVRIEPKTWDDV